MRMGFSIQDGFFVTQHCREATHAHHNLTTGPFRKVKELNPVLHAFAQVHVAVVLHLMSVSMVVESSWKLIRNASMQGASVAFWPSA